MRLASIVSVLACSALAADPTPAELAAPAAHAALEKSYAENQQKPDAVKQAHSGPWVLPERAQVSGDAKRGYTVQWTHVATAGFEYDVTVSVSPKGVVKVLKAYATFSPD